jgi:hypothetical protein
VRRVIPQDLQALYRRREILRALGTADPREARDLHTQVWLKLSQEFKVKRGKLQSGDVAVDVHSVQRCPTAGVALSENELTEWAPLVIRD